MWRIHVWNISNYFLVYNTKVVLAKVQAITLQKSKWLFSYRLGWSLNFWFDKINYVSTKNVPILTLLNLLNDSIVLWFCRIRILANLYGFRIFTIFFKKFHEKHKKNKCFRGLRKIYSLEGWVYTFDLKREKVNWRVIFEGFFLHLK